MTFTKLAMIRFSLDSVSNIYIYILVLCNLGNGEKKRDRHTRIGRVYYLFDLNDFCFTCNFNFFLILCHHD